ncbi:Protoglobin-domain-containing protein [Leptodontidium sp. 2 PMI_412]|nr:Protoglobin-domain-containing protein [Leptodontidium sp. 2 PMI_412]
MQHISATSLEDLPSRISYLSAFLELTPSDGEALLAAKPLVAPLIPAILDAVYNTDYEGELVKNVHELTLEHPQIALRKDFLKNYLVKLVSTTDLTPTSPFWVYLNNVGIMHTGQPGFKHRAKRPELRVEYIHMGALLGHVVDIVVGAVMSMDVIDNDMKCKVIRALNKVIWIQNDLMARHYLAKSGEEVGEAVTPPLSDGESEGAKGGCPFSG